MNKTRRHLDQLAFIVGVLGIALNVALVLLALGTVARADAIQMMAPALM